MKIALRGGHNKYVKGAMGFMDEQQECLEVYTYLANILKLHGHTVIDCNTNERTQSAEMSQAHNKANSSNVDYFISIHMNAFKKESANGTEVWLYSDKSKIMPIATRTIQNLVNAGFTKREDGVKFNPKFGDLKNVKAPSMIIETCFVTSKKDTNLFKTLGHYKVAKLIANAIDPTITLADIPSAYYRVVTNSFTNYKYAEEELKKVKSLGFENAWIAEYK